jgi:hypothetical protein
MWLRIGTCVVNAVKNIQFSIKCGEFSRLAEEVFFFLKKDFATWS